MALQAISALPLFPLETPRSDIEQGLEVLVELEKLRRFVEAHHVEAKKFGLDFGKVVDFLTTRLMK